MTNHAELSPDRFRFHTTCFGKLNPPSGTLSNLAYPSAPNFREAIAKALHAELGLTEKEHLRSNALSEFPDETLSVHFNILGAKKAGKGDSILVSAYVANAAGPVEWTRDLDLPVGGSPMALSLYELYASRTQLDGSVEHYWQVASLSTAAKSAIKALVTKPAKTGPGLLVLPDHICGVAFSPDGSKVAAADRKGNLGLFEFETGKLLWQTSVAKRPVYAITFHPDGASVFAGSQDIKRVDVKTGAATPTGIKAKYESPAVAVSPSGERLASVGGGILVVELGSGNVLFKHGQTDLDALVFVDEDTLLTGGGLSTGFRKFVIGAKTEKYPLPIAAGGPGYFARVRGGFLGRSGHDIALYDPETFAVTRTLPHPLAIPGVAFTTDGASRVLFASKRDELSCFDLASNAIVFSIKPIGPSAPEGSWGRFAIAANGRIAVGVDQGLCLFTPEGKVHLTPRAR